MKPFAPSFQSPHSYPIAEDPDSGDVRAASNAMAGEHGAAVCAEPPAPRADPRGRGSRRLAGLVLALVWTTGVGLSLGCEAARAGGELVTVSRYRVTPPRVEIAAGQEVTFRADENEALVESMLPVTVVIEGFARSPALAPGEQWRVVFDRPGLYEFYIEEHRGVGGSVIVE